MTTSSEPAALIERLTPYDAVVVMRERTPLPAGVLGRLPRLRLVVTTGRRNASIDVAAAATAGITVCGTESRATAPAELTWALILGLARHLVTEATAVRSGGWQTTVGTDLGGHTLGLLGLGRIGSQVAAVGRAFGMDVIAWSPHLTDERAEAAGARAVALDDLLAASHVVSVHLVLGESTPRAPLAPRARSHAARRAARQHLSRARSSTRTPCSPRSRRVASAGSASTSSTRSRCRSTTRCARRPAPC